MARQKSIYGSATTVELSGADWGSDSGNERERERVVVVAFAVVDFAGGKHDVKYLQDSIGTENATSGIGVNNCIAVNNWDKSFRHKLLQFTAAFPCNTPIMLRP